ncbi:hypothetical protein Tco_0701925, partial [Tanacetum coccineum]
MKMVPYEAFARRCGAEDVVLRESYKPRTHEERVRLLVISPGASTTPNYSPRPSTPPSYSPGPSTAQSYSPRPSRNAECSKCKLLLGKIEVDAKSGGPTFDCLTIEELKMVGLIAPLATTWVVSKLPPSPKVSIGVVPEGENHGMALSVGVRDEPT